MKLTQRNRSEFRPAGPPGMPRPRTSAAANLHFTRTSSEVSVRWIETGRIFWRDAAELSPGSIRRVNGSGMHMAIAGTLNVWGVSRLLWSGLAASRVTPTCGSRASLKYALSGQRLRSRRDPDMYTEVGTEATMIA